MTGIIMTIVIGVVVFSLGYYAMWCHVNGEGNLPDGVDWEEWL